MNRSRAFCIHGSAFVNRFTDDVHNAAKCFWSNRNHDGLAGVGHGLAAGHAVSRIHRDAAHSAFTQMLRYFEHKALAIMLCFQRAENCWQMPTFKFYVHNR